MFAADAFPPWPPDQPEIARSVTACLQSGHWSGNESGSLSQLASAIAKQWHCGHVLLCGSGSAATDFALNAAGVGAKDEVVLAGYDFPGNIRAVEQRGACAVLVDLAPGRYVPSIEAVEAEISDRTRAILLSHLYGNLLDARQLRQLADQRGLVFIEDACQAHGASIDGQPAGSWGHLATISFGSSKLMTAGCGGALLTSDERLFGRATLAAERPAPLSPMSPLQAVALLPQIRLLPEWTENRARAYAQLKSRLSASTIWKLPDSAAHETQPAFYKIAFDVPENTDRDLLASSCRGMRLPIGPGFVSFLKRANRRHQINSELSFSRKGFDQTLVMEHRVLLSRSDIIDQVADCLLAIESQL